MSILQGNVLEQCHIIEFPKVSDPRGNLTFIENQSHIPFDIQRVYYIYDVPDGAHRAGHAHKALHQILIAVSGSFDVILDDGRERRPIRLDRSNCGLYIAPLVWREIENFSAGSVCLALASAPYDEADYYRHYDAFLASIQPGA